MVYNGSEIISLVLVSFVIIKLIGISFNQKAWVNMAAGMIKNTPLLYAFSILISGVSLFYLLKEISIVQIYASMAFFAGLVLLSFAAFPDILAPLMKKVARDKNMLRKAWLAVTAWIALTVWVVYVIFV